MLRDWLFSLPTRTREEWAVFCARASLIAKSTKRELLPSGRRICSCYIDATHWDVWVE